MLEKTYEEDIKKVLKYIEENLSEELDLNKLSEISNFSKYHFLRKFKNVTGETPISFIKRKRMEKAVYYIIKTDMSILKIANVCGFNSLSGFNNAFKKHYLITPSETRKRSNTNSNFELKKSNNKQEIDDENCYNKDENKSFIRRVWSMNISVETLPAYEVAYVRHVGSYLETGKAWNQLLRWASQNGISGYNQYFIGISHDDPSIVEEQACRHDSCVTLPKGFEKQENEDVEFKTLSGGLYALYRFYDTNDKLALAYLSVFGQWLPNSEYEPDERECLEFCMNNPAEDPEGKSRVHLYVPIKKK